MDGKWSGIPVGSLNHAFLVLESVFLNRYFSNCGPQTSCVSIRWRCDTFTDLTPTWIRNLGGRASTCGLTSPPVIWWKLKFENHWNHWIKHINVNYMFRERNETSPEKGSNHPNVTHQGICWQDSERFLNTSWYPQSPKNWENVHLEPDWAEAGSRT